MHTIQSGAVQVLTKAVSQKLSFLTLNRQEILEVTFESKILTGKNHTIGT